MFKRVTHKERSSLTLAKLESLSEIGLENFLERSEERTLYRIIHTFDFLTDLMNEPLTQHQKEIQSCVFWELYFREQPQEQQETIDLSDLRDLDLHRERFLNAKKIGNVKQMLVNEKRRLKKDAWIAEIGEHASSKKCSRKKCSRKKYSCKKCSRKKYSHKTRDHEIQDVNYYLT
jgi:hypothetical protein